MHDMDADDRSALPPVVTPEESQQARDALFVITHAAPAQTRCRQGVEGCD